MYRYVYITNTISKQETDFEALPLMFLNAASRMTSYSTWENFFLDKAERTVPSYVWTVKSLENENFWNFQWKLFLIYPWATFQLGNINEKESLPKRKKL